MAPSVEFEYRGTVNAPMAPLAGRVMGGAPGNVCRNEYERLSWI